MEKISKFLIDSDILIDFLRGLNKTRGFLFKLRKEGELLISVINMVEIYSGKEIKNTKKRKIIWNKIYRAQNLCDFRRPGKGRNSLQLQ